jgi:hypothetical protein
MTIFSVAFQALDATPHISKPLTSLSCSLNAVFPGLKMWDTFACATAKKLIHFISSIAVLESVPLMQGYIIEPPFPLYT